MMQTPLENDRSFQRYYAEHLRPLEQTFEKQRRDAIVERNKRFVCALIALIAAIAGIVYAGQPFGDLWFLLGFFILLAALCLGAWAWLPGGIHELRLQDQVMSHIVPFFGELRYQAEPDLQPQEFREWMILPTHLPNLTHAEDQIIGQYRGVPLRLAEYTLKFQTTSRSTSSSSSSTSTHIAFDGLLIAFELDHEVPGVTLIRSTGSDMNGRFRIDDSLARTSEASGFEVFASSDAPGLRFANSRFLGRVAKVAELFSASHFYASFHARQLVIMIQHEGNYFEMSHRQITDFAKDAERTRQELQKLFSIADLLELKSVSDDRAPGLKPATSMQASPAPAKDRYKSIGWGCLTMFAIFAASTSAHLMMLSNLSSKGAQLWWSAIGGTLVMLGLSLVATAVMSRSVAKMLFGILFLYGAYAVLDFHEAPVLSGIGA